MMLSTAPALAFDDDDDFFGNTQTMPIRQSLLAVAGSADKTENAGGLDRSEPFESTEIQESDEVYLSKERPWTYGHRRSTLAAVPAIDIDDEGGIAFDDAAPSPVTNLLSNTAYAAATDDPSDITSEDEDETDGQAIWFADDALVAAAYDPSGILSEDDDEADGQAIWFADSLFADDSDDPSDILIEDEDEADGQADWFADGLVATAADDPSDILIEDEDEADGQADWFAGALVADDIDDPSDILIEDEDEADDQATWFAGALAVDDLDDPSDILIEDEDEDEADGQATWFAGALVADDGDDPSDPLIEDEDEDEADDQAIGFAGALVADDGDDPSDILIEDEDEADDQAIGFADALVAEAVEQDDLVLTSSGCSLKPHRRRLSKEVKAQPEIVLPETTRSDAVAFDEAEASPADMVLSTKTPGCDVEDLLYFTIGGMIIPSFFAEAAGLAVKTQSVSYDVMPSGWEASIEEISTAFETSSGLLAYLASRSDETAAIEAFENMPEQQSEFFNQEIKSARAKGYCLFAHSGCLNELFSVAVPVFADGEVIGAVGIFVPRALTCNDNLEKHLLPQLRLMAGTIAESPEVAKASSEATETETETATELTA